jgi:uncharacterized protein YkwD
MHRVTEFVVNLFTPTKKNNYHPKALHPQYLTSYLLYALLLTFLLSKFAAPLSNVLGFATDISQEKLYQLTNEKRKEHSLAPLNLNTHLSQAAAQKAQDMFRKNYWAHFGPSGETPWGFILDSGYKYEYAGENLAKNFLFSDGVVDAWMNSPTHRENILRSEYTDVGFAIANGTLNGEETTLVVQMFGKPLASVAINQLAQPIAAQTIPESVSPTQSIPSPTKIFASPTAAAIAAGQAVVNHNASQQLILGNQSPKQINLMPSLVNTNVIFFIFLMTAIAMDFYFAVRINVIRIGGKHIAHFIFIGFIMAGLLMSLVRGAIL